MDMAETWAAIAASLDELADEDDKARATLAKLKADGRHPEQVAKLEVLLQRNGEGRATVEEMRDDALHRSKA